MAESFTTTNRFFDNKNYPRGFSRHGDFTIKEAQLLERHGYAFNELDLGKREPQSEAERVWIKYMARIKRPKRFHTLSGGKPQMEGAEDYTESDD